MNLLNIGVSARVKRPMAMAVVAALALFTASYGAAAPAADQDEGQKTFQEGVQYERLPIPVDTHDPSKIEVVEVFSYACIHCKNFEPAIDAWLATKPDDVDFQRLPATFNQAWATLAQGYYTAEALGVVEQTHGPMFRAIHDRGVNLADPALMAELFEAAAGIPPEQFNQVFNSFSVRSRVQQADGRARVYRITGTPTVIVDGTYRVDARMAGTHEGMFEVVDYLIQRQRDQAAADAAEAADGGESQ